MGIFVDAGYRTRLGTSFYDRRRELDTLDSAVHDYRLVIVYGPRNVGKSELVYYWSRRRAKQRVIVFQIDAMRARSVIEDLDKYLSAPEERVKKIILSRLREELKETTTSYLRLLDLVYTVYEVVQTVKEKVVLFLDEFHMLPGYRASMYRSRYEEALTDLEALAHRLAKYEEDYLRIVLTVSEGFVATGEALSRLHGYNAEFMPVEHMDGEHFSALYNEYKQVNECSTDYYLLHGIVGGAPGYLAELCRGEHAVKRFVERSKTVLENSLSAVRNILAAEPMRSIAGEYQDPRQLIRLAHEVMIEDAIKPMEQPFLYTIGQLLTTHNIVYPFLGKGYVRFKPQIPLYRVLLEIAVERNAPSILDVETNEVIRRTRRQ